MPHAVIMAAGTGGHIMPGLAIAQELQARGWTVSWLGTRTGMEQRLVPPSGIPIDTIAFDGLRGKGWKTAFLGSLKLVASLVQAMAIFRRRRADVVVGMGGYVCLPGGLVSRLLRRPLMLVNADAALLLSNRVLRPFAQTVAFGFDGPDAQRCAPASVVTGNPIRPAIAQLPPPEQRWQGRTGPLRVLVLGGSLGARVLNDTVPRALALLPTEQRPIVVHQTGAAHVESVRQAYERLGIAGVAVDVRPFIDTMAEALAQCDVVVCRAGAITVSELCAGGVPSVLVPLVLGTTDHQAANARNLAARGAAVHLPQAELTPHGLAQLWGGLDRSGLLAMAQRARALARPQATVEVADAVERLGKRA